MEFIGEARNYLENHRLPSIRSYYLEACDAALAVVSDSGLDLLGEGRNIHLASFLVDMETVFENYVRNVLKEALPVANSELSVLDGNNEGKGWFYSDNKGHPAKPDLVLRSGKTVPMIGDVKYKAKLSEHDRYQVVAHALSFGAPIACIVMPTIQGETSGLERLGKVGTDRNVELFLYRINLETQDLGSEEVKMQDAICSLCASKAVPS
jgi:5-methylcytosine-specific restriction enzyme subunit McrC